MPRRLSRITLLLLLAAALAPGDSSPLVPWPHGEAPSAIELDALVADASSIQDREQLEEVLAAAEAGEESEHLVIFQEDIDDGLYSHDQLFQLGDGVFAHEFTLDDGYGDGTFTSLNRIHTGVRGGLDTFSCAGCHSVGGPDGAGSQTQNAFLLGDGDTASSAVVRNAPAMLGAGLVQALAAEMTQILAHKRSLALQEAKASGVPVTLALETKGVSFGTIVVPPEGALDVSKVEGVNGDLIVRPFGWKGVVSRLRRFVEDAARVHFGIQSQVLAENYEQNPDIPHLGPGPNWYDPDNDGEVRELEEGILTTTAVYLALLETPVILPPHDPGLRDRWANGSALFDSVGCAGCHKRSLELLQSTWHETSDTTGGAVTLELLYEGDQPRGNNQVALFSDLKRHAMGKGLADAHDNEQGLPRDVFLTRPLWGLAETPPYLHDGRAATIPAAILAHGGEAQASRDAFAALSAGEQADLHIFLLSLTREPKPRIAR